MAWYAICWSLYVYLIASCRKPKKQSKTFLFHTSLWRCFVILKTCSQQLIKHCFNLNPLPLRAKPEVCVSFWSHEQCTGGSCSEVSADLWIRVFLHTPVSKQTCPWSSLPFNKKRDFKSTLKGKIVFSTHSAPRRKLEHMTHRAKVWLAQHMIGTWFFWTGIA
jgi:hypothetical protein